MSTGAISQLVSVGHLNKFLNENPQISYFRFQSMRHTSFALENQLVQFQGTGTVGASSVNTVRLSRSGDLIYHMYAIIDLPGIANVSTGGETAAIGNKYDTSNTGTGPLEAVESGRLAAYNAMGGCTGRALEESTSTSSLYTHKSRRTINSVTDVAYHNQAVPYWTNAVGQFLIQKATFSIGSQPIDTLYSDYLFMLEELSGKPGKELKDMIGKYTSTAELKAKSKMFQRLYVPLPWFFTKNSGNSLPLVSLQFHDVRVEITWHGVADAICNSSGITGKGTIDLKTIAVVQGSDVSGSEASYTLRTVVRPLEASMGQRKYGAISIWGSGANDTNNTLPNVISDADVSVQLEVCYVYLGKLERQRFAEGSFEMLIDEVQRISPLTGQKSEVVSASLDFNHAVAEIIWGVRQAYNEQLNEWFNYGGLVDPLTTLQYDPIKSVMLKINNQERVYSTEGRYYRLVQPYQHHSRIPDQFVYSYSFSLHPEDAQPSGSCNFSRIDNSKLDITLDKYMFQSNCSQGGLNLGSTEVSSTVLNLVDGNATVSQTKSPLVPGGNSVTLIVFARNYNVLRITLGLAGKAFAN